jgi:hypothetical protein
VIKRIKIDEQSSFLLAALCMSLLIFDNGFYLFFPVVVIYLLIYLLQQPYKPGVFSLIAMQHFMQIAAAVWLCNFLGKDINYNTPSRSTAVIASSIGLCFLLAPIIYYQSKIPNQSRNSLKDYIDHFSIDKVMYLYIISFFIASFLGTIAFLFGGFTQIIFSLVKVKWILFLLFGYMCLLKKERVNIFYLFVLFEFLNGFLGFFSDFKTVIYFLIVLIISMLEKLDFKQVFFVGMISVLLGFFALTWTSIKGDYRNFLNGGEKSQAVVVERGAAADKLVELSGNVNNESLNGATEAMLDRLQYTYHFAKTIDRMPAVLPFENGANWLFSLEFTTTPRFLNPDKPTFDATEKTKKYTGIRYAGRKEGASFSLGYFPDCFIDFGIYGMMGVLFAIGMLYMFIYAYLLRKSSKNLVFNYAVVGAFFLEFNALEMDSTYLLGRLFSSMVTFYFLVQFVFPLIIRFITNTREKEEKSYSFR